MAEARRTTTLFVLFAGSLALTTDLEGQDAFQWSGFGVVRAASNASTPFEADPLSAQLQLGLDWSP